MEEKTAAWEIKPMGEETERRLQIAVERILRKPLLMSLVELTRKLTLSAKDLVQQLPQPPEDPSLLLQLESYFASNNWFTCVRAGQVLCLSTNNIKVSKQAWDVHLKNLLEEAIEEKQIMLSEAQATAILEPWKNVQQKLLDFARQQRTKRCHQEFLLEWLGEQSKFNVEKRGKRWIVTVAENIESAVEQEMERILQAHVSPSRPFVQYVGRIVYIVVYSLDEVHEEMMDCWRRYVLPKKSRKMSHKRQMLHVLVEHPTIFVLVSEGKGQYSLGLVSHLEDLRIHAVRSAIWKETWVKRKRWVEWEMIESHLSRDFPALSLSLEWVDQQPEFSVDEQRVHLAFKTSKEPMPEELVREDTLSLREEMLAYAKAMLLREEDHAIRRCALSDLKAILHKITPRDFELYVFGSAGNGFGLRSSDVDVSITLKDTTSVSSREQISLLKGVVTATRRRTRQVPFALRGQPVLHGRVPVVPLVHRRLRVMFDVVVGNTLACENTKLLLVYASMDQRVQVLGIIIKRWAKARGIKDASQGGLSSYCWILLLLFFLQQQGVIPNLQQVGTEVERVQMLEHDITWQPQPDWSSENTKSVDELLIDFFHYYRDSFPWETSVVSLRVGGALSKEEKKWTHHFIAVEDPFNMEHCVAQTMYKKRVRGFLAELKRGYAVLERGRGLHGLCE